MTVVVPEAASVPLGIDFYASLRSPDLLVPAMIPVHAGKKMANCVKKFYPSS